MTIDFNTFEEMEFPQHCDIVYVLHYIHSEGAKPIPFYVGESSRHVGRFGDYVSANFSAATDFKVGEAVKYLRKKGLRVVIKFQESLNRKEEEKHILQHLRSTFKLLNDLKGYRYVNSDASSERLKIEQFIEQIIENPYHIEDIVQMPNTRAIKVVGTSKVHSSNHTPADSSFSVPERIRLICQELAVVGEIIKRQDILREAKKRGINESSVLPADYCDNTETGKWSRHSFLHSIGPGRYILK